MSAQVARAVCMDCSWEGRRKWPSPPRPCPCCGGVVLRRLPGKGNSARERVMPLEVSWEQSSDD